MGTWYDGDARSVRNLAAQSNGTSVTASLESGFPIAVTSNVSLEPQAQVIYQHLSLDRTQDQVSSVSYGGADAVIGRLGLRLLGNYGVGATLVQPYLKTNIWRDFGGRDTVTFAGKDVIATQRESTALEVGGGVVAKLSPAVGIFATGGYTTELDNHHLQGFQGNLSMRVTW